MSLLNKAEVRTLVRNLIDDTGAKLWDNVALDLLIEGSLDELWGELIDTFSWLRWTQTTVATVNLSSPGYIPLWDSALPAITRFYRIQRVIRDGVEIAYADPRDVVLEGTTVLSAPENSYTILGATLHVFPYSMTSPITVHYNSLPEPFRSLGPTPDPDDQIDDDTLYVDWPDGYHMAYVYDAAAKAMEKGDREESKRLSARAEQSLYRLKAKLRKQTIGPITPWMAGEDPIMLGGV